MKNFTTVLLVILSVLMVTLFAACGSDSPATTKPAETTAPTGTSTGSVQTAPKNPAVTTTKPTITTTTPKQPDVTTSKPSQGFVEAEHIAKTDSGVTVKSLDQSLVMNISKNASGNIVYTLVSGNDEIIGESTMGITASNFAGFTGSTFEAVSAKELNVSYSHLGTFSTLTDNCVAATVTLKSGDYTYAIEIKLYNNGVAFRYNLPDTDANRQVKAEATTFSVNNIQKVWYGAGSDCYESTINGTSYSSISTSSKLNGPLMIELMSKKGYVALMEGHVSNTYIGTNYVSTGKNNTFKISGSWTANKEFDLFTAQNEIVTGWRIINYSKDLGDIVTNNTIYHTALGMSGDTTAYTKEQLDYITPGKSVWSWLNESGVHYDQQITYTLNAAKLGFTYNIIDEGYTTWDDYEAKLLELGLLADDVGVKQILWCAVPNRRGFQIASAAQAKTVMKKLAELHMSGIKLDFFNAETSMLTHTIQNAALAEGIANKIIINFHGVHKPVGYDVLYPNELTREGIRGLENMSKSDILAQAKYFTAQYYTRLLAGHADFTPDVNTAMQIASLVVLDSPLMVVATAPATMFKNPAFEMIRAIPTVWDQTVFLDGAIGSYVSVAKEKSGVWYIGGIASTSQANAVVDLSKILGDGEYLLTGWKDTTTLIKQRFTQTVTKDTVLELGKINTGCGYVMQITKLDISQHGGEITGPITVTKASKDAVVKYTLDGSDPMTSTTAVVAGDTITLTESALLRIAITEGDGKGTELEYQFNKVEYNGIEYNITNNDGNTVLSLTPTLDDAKLYYTTDGTTPTASSTLYTSAVTFDTECTVKVVAITDSGKVSPVKTIKITVRKAVTAIIPDVYIGKDHTEAQGGWRGDIYYDISMNNSTLSLGGLSASTGTKFSHGISMNATGYLVYNIPANAKSFVGVVGIDDSVYNNSVDGHKASIICKITVDGKVLHTTAKLARGQYEQINITLPEGAKSIRIDFGDAGDGITCDNVAFVEPGFITK
ncbi:MAG: glycoside hydrolase family 97 N-terminal domain-containing protein [Clostridia bacterium]|nr:glycoside hydrolase family 97 N-terminal domain-containing protein [Clostridia bacterium]